MFPPLHRIDERGRDTYHKQASGPRKGEKEERTLEAPKGDHHSPSSDDSLSP